MKTTFLLPGLVWLALTAVATAQAADWRREFATTPDRVAIVQELQKSLRERPRWDYFTLPDFVVTWEAPSDQRGQKESRLREVKEQAAKMRGWWDACQDLLPNSAERVPVFPVVEVELEPRRSVSDDGSRFEHPEVTTDRRGFYQWFESAWVATELGRPAPPPPTPAPDLDWSIPWLPELLSAYMNAYLAARASDDRSPHARGGQIGYEFVAWKAVERRLAKLTKTELAGLLGRAQGLILVTEMPAPDDSGRAPAEIAPDVLAAWAAFLLHGPRDLGDRFDPRWRTCIVELVRLKLRQSSAGATLAPSALNEIRRAQRQVLADLDAAAFDAALVRWVQRRR